MKSFTVKVTQSMIDKANAPDGSGDFIAQAVKSLNLSAVCADCASIRFTDKASGIRYHCETPLIARMAMHKFDAGEQVQPFNFILKPKKKGA